MRKTESPIKLNTIDSFELPDGSFDYFLRKNETIETRSQESVESGEPTTYQVYVYDEVFFNAGPLSDIESNFEVYFLNPPEKIAGLSVEEQVELNAQTLQDLITTILGG